MRRSQRDAQRAALGVASQHHDDERGTCLVGEVFGMAGEMHASIVDDAFVHRRRRHRGELAGLATGQCTVEQSEDVGTVGGIEPAGL